ncbi:hypothetical protein [Amorphus sp. 3PC139-8]|uniref:hypothetical protein n=1 Tax=Amorphus sp. 3PC139-8 TaxID=2735676 RepID=UPI00345D104F
MWVITALVVQLAAGPTTWVVSEAGTFETKDACQAQIESAVPNKLEDDDRERWEGGYQVYQCVKVLTPDSNEPPVQE